MTDELQSMKQQIVTAVQHQLTQYSEQVREAVQALREEIGRERTARTQQEEQLRALATGLERSHQAGRSFQTELQKALEERLTEFGAGTKRRHEEMNDRLDRMVDEANVGLAAAVESATRPVLREVEHRQAKVEGDVAGLDKSLRKFDAQAARMVTHINEATENIDTRIEAISAGLSSDVESRMGSLATRLDEVSAQAARQQTEVSNIVGQRVDDAESRINDKIATAESRITEDVGTRIADIDAYVGRVSVGLDEGIVMLNDRFSQVNTRFEQTSAQIAQMEQNLKDVDVEALDEMKEKVSSAVGEAVLMRIEMERLQESLGDKMDTNSVRLTELETLMQDQAMDTETAVQLERLEEVERAVIALDPAQFVRVDGSNARSAPVAYNPADTVAPNGGSMNGASMNGASPNGASPNGASPNGASPNGASPNGAAPNGAAASGGSSNGGSANGSTNNGSTNNGPSINSASTYSSSSNGASMSTSPASLHAPGESSARASMSAFAPPANS